MSRSSASRTMTPSRASSTSTRRRALLTPEKKMRVPAAAISDPADIQRVGQSFAHRRTCRTRRFHAVEHVEAGELDRLETRFPEPQLHGGLVDGGIGERNNHVGADQDARGQEFGELAFTDPDFKSAIECKHDGCTNYKHDA